MSKSVYATHNLNIGIGTKLEQDQLNDVSKHIRKMAGEWQDVLDNAIKSGIEEGARSASIKDVLTQFNAQLKAAKLEPLTITVNELEIMDKPIEHAAKLLVQKLGNAFKGGGIGNIISSEITDSLNNLGDTVGKIYKKMEQGAEKSAKNIAKSMHEIEEAARKVSGSPTKQNKIHSAIGGPISMPTDGKKRKDQFGKLYTTSKSAAEDGASWVEQYSADVKFVRGFQKLTNEQKTEVYGKNLAAVQAYYDKLEAVHEEKMIALNNILALNDYTKVNKAGKITTQYNFKADEPWAREKTLQEIKAILGGGLTVKDKGADNGRGGNNLNSSKLEGDLSSTIELRINAEKRAQEAAKKIAEIQEKMQKQGFTIYRGINEEDAAESRQGGQYEYGAEYWAKDREAALSYAVGSEDDTHTQLLKTIVSPKNPLVLDMEGREYGDIKDIPALINTLKELGLDIRSLFAETSDVSADEIQQTINKFAKNQGYDSVITNNVRDANLEGAPITSTVAILDDSILSTIQAFDVVEGVLQEAATKIAEWYHVPDQSNIDGVVDGELEAELAQLRQEQDAALKDIDKYIEKEENLKKRMDKLNASIESVEGSSTDPSDSTPTKPKGDDVTDGSQPSAPALSEADSAVLSNLSSVLTTLSQTLGAEKPEAKATIDATELSGVLHDGKPYLVDLGGEKKDQENNKVSIDTEGLKNVLTGIVFKIKQIDNEKSDPEIVNLLHKLVSGGSDKERFAYLNTRTREASGYIEGEYGSVGVKQAEDFRKTDSREFDSTLHTHPTKIAVPSPEDFKNQFIKHLDEFKKNFILGTEEIAEIDFSRLNDKQIDEIYNKYDENVVAKELEYPSLKDIGIDSVDMDLLFSELQKQLSSVFPELSAQIQSYVDDLKKTLREEDIINTSIEDVYPTLDEKAVSHFTGDSAKYLPDISTVTDQVFNEVSGEIDAIQKVWKDIFKQTLTDLGYDVSQIFKTYNIQDFVSSFQDDEDLRTISEATDDKRVGKVAIDTTELKGILESTTFKVQDVSEKEPTSSAIDQESINSLVGAIKAGLTPQNDGTKDSGPWAREETLRNITGSTLGKIVNKIPKVDTKGLARNDILNRVAQAAEAINKKISGKISGNVSGPAAAQQSQLFDAKIQSRVSKLQTKYTKLDASGQLTPEIGSEIMGLWDDLNNVKDQPEFSLWLQQLQQVENKIQQIIELNKLNEQETKASVSAITATHKQYYDAIINAEKAKNAELQRFWLDESNKSAADLEVLQDEYEAETGARVDLTKEEIEYEKKLGAIKADKAGKAKAAQEKKDAKDHNSAVLELIDSYEELGRMRARRDAMSNSTERTALQQEIRNTSTRLGRKAVKLGQDPAKMKDMADVAQAEEAAAIAAKKHKEEYGELVEKIKERKKLEEKSAGAKENSKFKQDIDDDISKLNDEIDLMQKRIKLTKEEQAAIDELNKKRDDSVRDKKNKKQDQADTKAFREELKQTRKKNNIDIANSRLNAGRKVLTDNLLVLDDTIDPTIIPEVNELRVAWNNLENQYNAVNQAMQNGDAVSDEEILDLNKTSDAVAKKIAALKEMLAHYEKFKNGENIGAYIPGVDEEDQVRSAVNQKFGGKAKIKGFSRDASGLLTANVEVKEGARTFTEYAVAVERADGSIRSLKGNTKQLPGFLDGVKRKLGEISQYVSAMSVISRLGQELRRGLQIVRDIDLAMTELKKVTDETDATYEKFLNTASKVGKRLGATISDVTEATATFAKLGYNIKQATEMAESAIVYKNVGDNIASTEDAADSIISTLKGFNLNASESMRIVNSFNEVGNRFAITSQGIGEALRLSASALSEGGNSLDESIGLITAANEVVQDPSSVGTALKTLTLRLRGSKTELEEIGEDVSGMAETTSSLQAKLLALTGGQVDIMLNETTFKNSTQILREMAAAWEDMDDISRASALELMGGKRQANVLSALIQNFDTVENAIESSANSTGSALRENEKYLDSIQGRIDQFNNTLQTMWKNVLDDDVVKLFIKIGTALVEILNTLGPIKTLFAGIAVYAMRKNGIAGFGDIFKKSAPSIDSMREKLVKLRQEYDKLDGTKSQKNLRKQDKLGGQIKEIEAEIEAYDNLTAKRDEAFKKRDAAQAKLKEAQDELTNAWAQGETGNVDSDDIEKLSQRVDAAKVEFEKADIEAQEFDKTVKKTGKTGNATFQGLSASVKNFTKELLKSLGQMLVMMAVMKIFEVVGGWIDDAITTAEEAAEAFEELTSELEDTKQAIQDIEGELEAINDKIAEINSQESLSFADEEEIARLKEERAILERNLQLNEELAKQKQQQVNNQVSDQVEYYKNKGIDSGKTRDEKTLNGAKDGALIGAGVAGASLMATGGAAGLATALGVTGATQAWNPVGWGLLIAAGIVAISAAIGTAVGDASGYFEEKVGESIENMGNNLKEKQDELEKARKKYQETGKDGDKEKYEEAQKALSDYRGEMAKYFTDIDAMYKNVDLKSIEDPDEYARLKKEMEDFYNERDKWLIKSGAEGAKVGAIERIFDKEELKEASANIDALLQKLKENPGDNTILALIANQAGLAKEDLEAVELSVDDAIAHFTQFSSGINTDAMVDPMKTAMSAIDTYTSKMETLASIQSEVADGFIISAEKAREFSAVYPEILQSAKATADGQIQLNSGVVNALISGERSEADAAMETDKQKIEGTIATLEAKKSYLEAQLVIMEAEAEGNRQLAINQVELMQEHYNQAVEANIGEAEAYKLAVENKAKNATEFSKVVADVANDTSANMSGAASQMSKDIFYGYKAGADSANAFGRTAANAINALKDPFWKPVPFGGNTASGSGGFKSNVTSGSFTGLQIDKKILDVKFDNLKLNLTNQLNSVNEAIANAYGALALMDTNIQAPLSSFDPDKDSGGKDDAPTKFEKMQAAYEAALANLEHRQKLIQGQIDILEAQHKGVSSKYYNELIKGENDKINLYEGQLELFRALLKVTPETNEEYNEIVEIIQELELNIQEATLAAIEFGEAMNDNFLKSVTDLGDAYENLYNINDRQKSSMELYKEGVEIGGGQVNEGWYDHMISKAGEAGDLARQELQDSLNAIDLWRGKANPFEKSTAEFEAWEYDRNTKLQEAWAQAADAKDKIQEADNEALQLAEDKKDAYIEAWDNITTAFERIGGLFEDQISLIDGYEARLEALNINVPDEVYKKKIAAQNNFIGNLDEQIAYDEKLLAEYAAKYGTNDERYMSKWEELNDKRVQRYEAETEIIQIEQQIIDNQIDRFNQTIDRTNNAVDKMNNIKGLVSDEEVADEDGNWTAEGLTQAGLGFQEMAYQKEMIAAYADEMEELTELYEQGKISEKEYYEQMKELEDGQWSAINAYKAAEDSLVDLEEARIDALENGLQEEIDAYRSLIELKRDELLAEKD